MGRSYFVGGVSGVGKSTLLEAVSNKQPDMRIVHGASMLLRALGLAPNDYEALRNTNENQKNSAYARIVMHEAVDNVGQPGVVVFDSHYLNLVRGGVHRTVGTLDESRMFALDGLILVTTTNPATIYNRVARDTSRDRALFPVGATEATCNAIMHNYCDATQAEFERLTHVLAMPSLVIRNEETGFDQAVAKFMAFDATIARPL